VRILRHRPTRHFVAVLVECGCGRKFLHRLDRPLVACFVCGRAEHLAILVEKVRAERQAARRRSPRAARRAAPRR